MTARQSDFKKGICMEAKQEAVISSQEILEKGGRERQAIEH